MKIYGYLGLAIILSPEILLFSGNQLVGGWFTPIVWTGYILLLDALVLKVKGSSLLMSNRVELLIIAVVSIGCWWLFEFYNAPRFWRSDLELCNRSPPLCFPSHGTDGMARVYTPA
jgi:hypothetical protein